MNKKLLIVIGIIVFVGGVYYFKNKSSENSPTYQTAMAEKGTLVSTVSASGNIGNGNNISITTSASGTVGQVFVKNGDTVVKGQKIAIIVLDQDSLQRQSQAWGSYLSAKNQLASAQTKMYSLQSAAFKANQALINDAVARDLATNDPTYIQENANWLQAEADYKNQAGSIEQAQVSVTSAWYAYQQISSTITAPSNGVITNLTIAPGLLISGTSSTSQKVGTIAREKNIQASVSLSETDAVKVKAGQKVTIAMDAFADKTFTGKVLMIDTNGQTSSGVTNYPVTILFDTASDNIYPNMGVNVKIITEIKDKAIIVPVAAVSKSNGVNTVRVMKDGKVSLVDVEVGISSDTQTEILSGLSEGETVVTSVSTTTKSTTTQGGTSVFGGGFGGRNQGGTVRGVMIQR